MSCCLSSGQTFGNLSPPQMALSTSHTKDVFVLEIAGKMDLLSTLRTKVNKYSTSSTTAGIGSQYTLCLLIPDTALESFITPCFRKPIPIHESCQETPKLVIVE